VRKMEDFWSAANFHSSKDSLNRRVSERSPLLTLVIHRGGMLQEAGDIGAQQAMINSTAPPLPWVPDIVGTESGDRDAVLFLGSAYSPFFAGFSDRGGGATLEAPDPRCYDLTTFCRDFLCRLVSRDAKYYAAIRRICGDQIPPTKILVTDLCRASFCRRGDRRDGSAQRFDSGGDRVAYENPELFRRYTESLVPRSSNWKRITGTKAVRVVTLGTLAEHGLLRQFHLQGDFSISRFKDPASQWRFRSTLDWPKPRPALSGSRVGRWAREQDWWVVRERNAPEARVWHVLPVPHPSARGGLLSRNCDAVQGVLAHMLPASPR
jgi:hypothetical protein